MGRFTIPRDVYFGSGVIEQLKEITGTRALVCVGSERLIESGVTAKVQALLQDAGIESLLYHGHEPDPTFGMAHRCAVKMMEYQPDVIVAIGGGSSMDATKAAWTFYEYPELSDSDAAVPFGLPPLRRKAKFIAVTTTSGTGSEVTSFAVVANDATGIKYPMADYNLTPDLAIVDTDLVETLTPELVANTGMDALTHAIEAYVSPARSPFTDALALHAIELIFRDLYDSYIGDMTARSNMHLSQCMAGMAFSNAILGIVHSMAHKTGRVFGIPHGCANAIYLTYVIQYNAVEAAPLFADIAKRLGLSGSSDKELTNALIALIADLRAQLHIPASLKKFGVDEQEFLDKLEVIAPEAVADPCTGTNPRAITPAQMTKLFLCTYYGNPVDF